MYALEVFDAMRNGDPGKLAYQIQRAANRRSTDRMHRGGDSSGGRGRHPGGAAPKTPVEKQLRPPLVSHADPYLHALHIMNDPRRRWNLWLVRTRNSLKAQFPHVEKPWK